ncbi:MAG TPA: hypothetical protein VNL15_06640 [Dehalococcoidia bacterium]|nr:hypothetical protein [Dehalococcoidia bacterium]
MQKLRASHMSLAASLALLLTTAALACGSEANPETAAPTAPPNIVTEEFRPAQIVTSLEEATRLTGYPVATLDAPPEFRRVVILVLPASSRLPARVSQVWAWESDPSVGFDLYQDPGPGSPADGIPVEINGHPGLRLESPGITLFWRDETFGYHLNVKLGGPLTEELAYKLAASGRTN